jgi:hypothetical protein
MFTSAKTFPSSSPSLRFFSFLPKYPRKAYLGLVVFSFFFFFFFWFRFWFWASAPQKLIWSRLVGSLGMYFVYFCVRVSYCC